jgi:hypothetical protein
MQAVVLAMAGFDDDEPPEFIRQRNFIVPLPDGRTIPVKITKDESDQSGDMKAFMATLSTSSQDSAKMMENLMTTMGDKMDTMITYLKASAGHQEDLVISARNS